MKLGTMVRMLRKSSDAYGEIGEIVAIEDGKFMVKFAGHYGWFEASRRNLAIV